MKILNIHIQNFLSIDDVYLEFNNGIFELNGLNYDKLIDGKPSSNGSGKSSILLAVQQCLFNKNSKVSKLESISNNVSMKPYLITINLVGIDGNTYEIINDRNKMLFIIKNVTEDRVLTTRIKDSLGIIEDIIGLSYDEFILLTYINQSSIHDVFNSTDSNLILKFFKLTKLTDYLEKLKLKRRDINVELKRLNTVKSQANTYVSDKEIQILEEELVVIKDSMLSITTDESIHSKNTELQNRCHSLHERILTLSTIQKDLENKNSLINFGVCPTCNQDIPKDDMDVSDQLESVNENLGRLNKEYAEAQDELKLYSKELTTKLDELKNDKVKVESKLISMRHLQGKEVDNLEQLKEDIANNEYDLSVIKSAIDTIESGKVHEAYLYTFLIAFNDTVRVLLNSIGSNTEITARIYKGSIFYNIIDDGIDKNIQMLSSGEKTLYALVILVSLFRNLKAQLGLEINLMFLDEAISNVDNAILQKVQDILKEVDGKTMIITQHHNELPKELFDSEIIVEKHNGLSTIKG